MGVAALAQAWLAVTAAINHETEADMDKVVDEKQINEDRNDEQARWLKQLYESRALWRRLFYGLAGIFALYVFVSLPHAIWQWQSWLEPHFADKNITLADAGVTGSGYQYLWLNDSSATPSTTVQDTYGLHVDRTLGGTPVPNRTWKNGSGMMMFTDASGIDHKLGSRSQSLILENGWSTTNYSTVELFKDRQGSVHLGGEVIGGECGQKITTLPVGFRPQHQLDFGAFENGVVAIFADGSIIPFCDQQKHSSLRLSVTFSAAN